MEKGGGDGGQQDLESAQGSDPSQLLNLRRFNEMKHSRHLANAR